MRLEIVGASGIEPVNLPLRSPNMGAGYYGAPKWWTRSEFHSGTNGVPTVTQQHKQLSKEAKRFVKLRRANRLTGIILKEELMYGVVLLCLWSR